MPEQSVIPLPPQLWKPIDPTGASGLRVALGLPPDAADIERHIRQQREERLAVLDASFGLNPRDANLPEKRARAMIELHYGVPADDPNWWAKLSGALIREIIPGFTVALKKRGRERTWTIDQLLDLASEIESLKSKHPDLSIKDLCRRLTTRRPHKDRWGRFGAEALAKAYTSAATLFASRR